MSDQDVERRVIDLLPIRKGHFRYESGHHSDSWIALELLCLRPESVEEVAVHLSDRLSSYNIDAVCGPLVEGAFVALMVASRLGVPFTYAERFENPQAGSLYSVQYRVPGALRGEVSGRRIAIVNDVISAGSAVRGTLADLTACGAQTVAVSALAVLGPSFPMFAAENHVPLEALVRLPSELWIPSACPLCKAGVPLLKP